jgi:hypothetical protein
MKPQLQTFKCLEDALLMLQQMILATGPINCNGPTTALTRRIKPARYDWSAIENISGQLSRGIGFTDRQQELVVKLVTKYSRQWKKNGYDVSDITMETPVRYDIRSDIDRRRAISVVDRCILIHFPYIPKLVSIIGSYAHGRSAGSMAWNKQDRQWECAATAENINWCVAFALNHNFNVDESFTALLADLELAYDFSSIQLDIINDELVIHDAPASMLDWIANNVTDFSVGNIKQIAGLASDLAFTLSPTVTAAVNARYPTVAKHILKKTSFTSSSQVDMFAFCRSMTELDHECVVLYTAKLMIDSQQLDNIYMAFDGYNIINTIKAAAASVDMPDRALASASVAAKLAAASNTKSMYYSDVIRQVKLPGRKLVITNTVLPFKPDLVICNMGYTTNMTCASWFNTANKTVYYCPDISAKLKKIIEKQ